MPDYEPIAEIAAARAAVVAATMLKRYSSAKVAEEMAHWHAMDYPEGDERRTYWQQVGAEIARLSRGRRR